MNFTSKILNVGFNAAPQVGAAAVAVTAYGAYSSNKNAKKARAQQNKAMDKQEDVAKRQLEFAREQWDLYKDKILPIEMEAQELGIDAQELAYRRGKEDFRFYKDFYMPYQEAELGYREQALERADERAETADEYRDRAAGLYETMIDDVENLEPQYDRVTRDAAMDVDRNFERQAEIDERNAFRMGLRPDSGRFQDMERGRGLNQAATRAHAVNRAREGERDRVEGLKYNRTAPIAQAYMAASGRGTPRISGYSPQNPAVPYTTPRGINPANAMSGYGTAANAFGNQANFFGKQASMYDQSGADALYAGAQLYGQFKGSNPASSGGGSGLNTYGLNSQRAAELTGWEYKDGGMIPDPDNVPNGRGLVTGPPGEDQVPAMVDGQQPARISSGEYVVPRDVVQAKGTEFFDKLVEQYHQGPPPGRGLQRGGAQ